MSAVGEAPLSPVPAKQSSSVHPIARWVSGLFSPMSLKDQSYVATVHARILWTTLCISFPIAYIADNIFITVGCVAAAVMFCLVCFVPNWLQHPDPLMTFADDTAVYYYNQQYNEAKKAKQLGTTTTDAEMSKGTTDETLCEASKKEN